MGPVINQASMKRIEDLIAQGVEYGATAVVDGRSPAIPGYEDGSFVRPTVLQNVDPAGSIAKTEIFGPVLSLIHVNTIDEAIKYVNSGQYGNMACLFTSSGAAARQFRYEVVMSISASMWAWPPRWLSFLLAAGRRASLVLYTARVSMPWSSSPRPRWWWNAGRRNGRDNFRLACQSVYWRYGCSLTL
jgi:hypothetical protein